MNALEVYPPFNNKHNNDGDEEEEYGHAKKLLATGNDRNRKCGTLSKSEWEAACK